MVTVTARKHIIAAIRRATLCSQRTAMNIVDANWYRVHSFDADMRLAEITINLTNPDDFSGQLSLWDNKRSEEHTSELQSLMRISYAVFCLKKKKTKNTHRQHQSQAKTQEKER